MQLIPDWRQAWRYLSIQIATLAVVWGALPPDQQAAVLALLGIGPERVPLAVGLAVIVARLLSQPSASAAPAEGAGRLPGSITPDSSGGRGEER